MYVNTQSAVKIAEGLISINNDDQQAENGDRYNENIYQLPR